MTPTLQRARAVICLCGPFVPLSFFSMLPLPKMKKTRKKKTKRAKKKSVSHNLQQDPARRAREMPTCQVHHQRSANRGTNIKTHHRPQTKVDDDTTTRRHNAPTPHQGRLRGSIEHRECNSRESPQRIPHPRAFLVAPVGVCDDASIMALSRFSFFFF